jgi:hypothetical protein
MGGREDEARGHVGHGLQQLGARHLPYNLSIGSGHFYAIRLVARLVV